MSIFVRKCLYSHAVFSWGTVNAFFERSLIAHERLCRVSLEAIRVALAAVETRKASHIEAYIYMYGTFRSGVPNGSFVKCRGQIASLS